MKYIIPTLTALTLFTASCSRSGGISLEKEQKDSVPSVTVPAASITASDSSALGEWSLIKERFDHPDPYPPGTIITGTLSLKKDFVFVKTRNGVLADSGRFRIIDTIFYSAYPRTIIIFKSTYRKPASATDIYFLKIQPDSLFLHTGFIGFDYKRVR